VKVEAGDMKTVKFGEWGRALFCVAWIISESFPGISSTYGATNMSPSSAPTTSQRALAPADVSRLQFSPGVGDVVKLVKSDVNADIIKAFISRSPISYNPSAQEIIALKRLGVPDDITKAMLAHLPPPGGTPQPPLQSRLKPTAPLRSDTPPAPASSYLPFAPGYPLYPYSYFPGSAAMVFPYAPVGPLFSFNNSFPTFVNGHPVYSGYYLPGYGLIW